MADKVVTHKGQKYRISSSGVHQKLNHDEDLSHLMPHYHLDHTRKEKIKNNKIKPIRIAFITAMWKRPEIFILFAEGIKLLQESFPEHEIQCFVSGSEGRASKSLCDKYGFEYIEHLNTPMVDKINAAAVLCENYDPDYTILVGSDDLIAPSLFKVLLQEMNEGIDYIYLLDWYFYDTISKQGLYWAGYIQGEYIGHPCGPGRCLSRYVMQQINYQPFLRNFRYNNLLDTAMDYKVNHVPKSIRSIRMKDYDVMALDVKSETNLTKYARWPNTFEENMVDSILYHFGDVLGNKILHSKKT